MVIENVARKETGPIVAANLRSAGYVTRSWLLNSGEFALPQSRTRLFVLGLHSAKMEFIESPDGWTSKLEAGSWRIRKSINI